LFIGRRFRISFPAERTLNHRNNARIRNELVSREHLGMKVKKLSAMRCYKLSFLLFAQGCPNFFYPRIVV